MRSKEPEMMADRARFTTPTPRLPFPRPGVLDVQAYTPGGGGKPGPHNFKLSSNESPLGASKVAIQAAHSALSHPERYPEGGAPELRAKLGTVHKISAERIVCGAGSDELLKLLCYAYLRDGDEAIMSRHSFLTYKISAQAAGAQPILVNENDFRIDLDHALSCVSPRTRLVFLANPNNPTGTCVPSAEILQFHRRLPENVLLILDEAYAEYVERNDYVSGLGAAQDALNLVVLRTFSKIYGLASLRLGWCYGPAPVVDVLNRIRSAFNISTIAAAAGVASLNDQEHITAARLHNSCWLPWVSDNISALGLDVTPSAGNFLLVHFPTMAKRSAHSANGYLAERGVIVRQMDGYGFPDALRISIGSEAANRRVIELLRHFVRR